MRRQHADFQRGQRLPDVLDVEHVMAEPQIRLLARVFVGHDAEVLQVNRDGSPIRQA